MWDFVMKMPGAAGYADYFWDKFHAKGRTDGGNEFQTRGGMIMAKAGMRRPSPYDPKNHGTENHERMHHPKNEQAKVPEIQGAAKSGNAKAGPVNAPNWARDDYKAGNKSERD